MTQPKIVGVCGPSGSGKTSLVSSLLDLSGLNIVVVPQDNFYFDRSSLEPEILRKYNFDSIAAVDFDQMKKLVARLLVGETVYLPEYDFHSKQAREGTEPLSKADLILVEGTMIFQDDTLSNMLDLKILLDIDLDVCFIRRLLRDTRERGYSVQEVCDYYIKFVRPQNIMYSGMRKEVDFCISESDPRSQSNELCSLISQLIS